MKDAEVLDAMITACREFADAIAKLTGHLPDDIEFDVPPEQWSACAHAIHDIEATARRKNGGNWAPVELGMYRLKIVEMPRGNHGPMIWIDWRERRFRIAMNRRSR